MIGAAIAEFAYRPLLDPLPLAGYEWALLPAIAFLLSMAYRGVRSEHMDRYWRGVCKVTGVILLVMVAASAGSWALIEFARLVAPA
ncbi:MAG: hypothetical protein ACTS22_09785 [Phycisphaerales bacterium]